MLFEKGINKILMTKQYWFVCSNCGLEYKDYIRPGAEICPACKSITSNKGEIKINK